MLTRTKHAEQMAQALDRASSAFHAVCDDPQWAQKLDGLLSAYSPADDDGAREVEGLVDELIDRLEEESLGAPDGPVTLGWHAATLRLASDPQLRTPPSEDAAVWVMVGAAQTTLLLLYDKHALGAAMEIDDGKRDAVVPYTAKKREDVEAALLERTSELEDDGCVLAQPPTPVVTRLPDGTPSAVEVVRAAATAGVTGIPGWS